MALANAASLALLECRDGRIVWANEALAALVGTSAPDDLVGQSPDAFLHDAGAGLPDWLGGEASAAPGPAVECRVGRDPATCRTVSVRSLGAGGFEIHDVTPLRALERETHALGAALLETRTELAAAREQVEGQRSEREHLLNMVSHELQTPLTVLTGFTRLLLEEQAGPLTDEQRKFLGECARSCESLRRFATRLQHPAGAKDGSDLEIGPCDLSASVEAVVALLSPIASERGLRMEVELQADAQRARFDPARIEQVLTNLLGNALKYGRPGGAVRVQSRRLAAAGVAFVEVAVSDDGPGVPPADRERIFRPYERGVPEPSGLGLGLAICRRIVEAHGGTIGIAEAPEGGARFAFTLPAPEAG